MDGVEAGHMIDGAGISDGAGPEIDEADHAIDIGDTEAGHTTEGVAVGDHHPPDQAIRKNARRGHLSQKSLM